MRKTLATIVLITVVAMLAMGQTQIFNATDSLGPGDATGPGGDWEDTYQFRVLEGTTVEVIAASEDLDTYIRATLPDGREIENDDYQEFNAGFSEYINQGGTLTVHVSSLYGDEEGSYRITAVEMGEAQSISVGDTVRGSFGKRAGGGSMVDMYNLTGSAGQRIVVELVSDDFDAFLEVTGVDGTKETNDDGFGEGLDSRLTYDFNQDGQIMIAATSYSRQELGSYELRVYENETRLADQFNGILIPGESEYGYDGQLYDRFEFEGQAGQQVEFLLESDAFDAALYLARPDGSNYTYDDDGGGGTNSRIQAELPESGTYTLYITSIFSDAEGRYTLSIFR